jgi:hypothetical protein
MPTPTYVSASNYLKGVASTETALNISGFTQRWSDEKMLVENKVGSPTGFVHNFLVSTSCTLSGETNVSDLSTVGGFAFGVAETIANSISGYGVSAGGWYMDDFEIVQERGSLSTATANFTKHPDIA